MYLFTLFSYQLEQVFKINPVSSSFNLLIILKNHCNLECCFIHFSFYLFLTLVLVRHLLLQLHGVFIEGHILRITSAISKGRKPNNI